MAGNDTYWGNTQTCKKVKHDLIRNYLNGWFPKLGMWAGKIIYCDTHAGRGRHKGGELGSPLVALKTFLDHQARPRILQKSKVLFSFIERDDENKAHLDAELRALGDLPPNIVTQAIAADSFTTLQKIISDLRGSGQRMAPAFLFIDPYGFSVPGGLLRDLMKFERVELFLNLIWRELGMAIRQGGVLEPALDRIFAGEDWRKIAEIENHDARADETVNAFRRLTGAKWATRIKMLGPNNATRYMLVHLTNHDAGRELMKECVWRSCPDGGYFARKTDDPNQELLIQPEPNLRPLEAWIERKLECRPMKWQELHAELLTELWLPKHLNSVVKEMLKKEQLAASEFKGRVSAKANPLLALP